MVIVRAHPLGDQTKNPYIELLYGAVRQLGVDVRPFKEGRRLTADGDVVHVHWPERFVRRDAKLPSYLYFKQTVRSARKRQVGVVWTVHNLRPHTGSSSFLRRRAYGWLSRNVDGWFALSEAGHDAAIGLYPALADVPVDIVPHGSYRGWYVDNIDRETARRQLGVSSGASLILFFGRILEYKNVPTLVLRFLEASRLTHGLRLVVAGNPQTARIAAEVVEARGGDEAVDLRLGRIADEDVQVLFRAADLAVFPSSEVLHSGSVMLALSFDCPVLVPDTGSMRELSRSVGDLWVRRYGGDLAAGDILGAADWAIGEKRPATAPLDHISWEVTASKTVGLYRRVAPASDVLF